MVGTASVFSWVPPVVLRARCGHTPVGERDSMNGSRRAAITASVIGALLVAGAPTFAFGDSDAAHESKANSVAVQKAKDADDKKADDKKGDSDKKAADN